jgi:FG-GAP repeat protein
MLALAFIHNPDNSWTIEPEQMRSLPGGGMGPDPNYYLVDLIYHEGSNSVQCDWVDLTRYFGPMNDAANGTFTMSPVSIGHEPDIVVALNDPGLIQPTAPMGSFPLFNEVEMEDRTSRTAFPHAGGPTQDETFLLNEWTDPILGQLGPAIEFDTNTTIADDALPTPNMMMLWENSANLLPGEIGANSSGTTQTLSVFDSTFLFNPIQVTTGNDRFYVAATDPLTDTTLGGGGFIYPGHFQRPVPGPNFLGDEFDVSSDVATKTTDDATFAGDLNGIQGPLTIAPEAGPNTVIISDKGNTTLANPYNVQISSTVVDPIANQIVETIDGFAPAPISLENLVPTDPFNPPNTISSIALTMIAADAPPLSGGSPLATYTISGTLEFSNVVGHPTWINTLTIDGGASGLNEFDFTSPAAGNSPVAENVISISTGDGDFNTVNLASDAPANTGDMTSITSAIVINAGAGVSNVVNMVDTTDPNGVKATAVNVTGAGGLNQLQNGVVYTRFTGFTPASISLSQATGGVLTANVFGSTIQPLNFNLQSDSFSALNITTGDSDQNHVVLGSTAPLFTGTVSNIPSTVTVNFGAGILNTLVIADKSGTVSNAVLLQNDATGTFNQITGYTTPLIQYSSAAGGHLDVLLFASNVAPTTFTVGSTLGAGTTLELDGGTSGNDTFNIQGAAADTVTVNAGFGKNNIVNVSSDAPANTGDLSQISSTTQLTVTTGGPSNSLVVSDVGDAGSPTIGLTSTQITGLTALPIAYAKLGGSLAISLLGANAQPTTFNVTSTLSGLGNNILLVGGNAGGNLFNIGSDSVANNGQLNSIGAAITVNGGAGFGNLLEVDDHGSTGAFSYIVSPTAVITDFITPRPFGGVIYSNIQNLQLDATEQKNKFTVTPSTTTTYQLNAYGPISPPAAVSQGDAIALNVATGVATLTQTANPPGSNSFDGQYTFSDGHLPVSFTSIENFPGSGPILAYGADASVSGQPLVKVVASGTTTVVSTFLAYEANYHGGVRVAVGYFDNSGQQEIATAPGAGHAPLIKVFDAHGTLLYQFMAYASSVNTGLNIAAGNIEKLSAGANELDDIVTVPSRGVSEVRVFNQISTHPVGVTPPPLITPLRKFTVWGASFIGGSSVAVADLTGDGRADVIVGSGSGMAPTIEAFNVQFAAASYTPFRTIHPFTSTFRGGVNVSAISAGTGVATPEIIASQGSGGTSLVQMFNGASGALQKSFSPFAGQGSNAPVRTTAKVINGKLVIYASELVHGNTTSIRQIDPGSGAIVDYIFETDPNFLGIFLS